MGPSLNPTNSVSYCFWKTDCSKLNAGAYFFPGSGEPYRPVRKGNASVRSIELSYDHSETDLFGCYQLSQLSKKGA